jgi:hypothetical protein
LEEKVREMTQRHEREVEEMEKDYKEKIDGVKETFRTSAGSEWMLPSS